MGGSWTFPGNTTDSSIIGTVKDDLAGWNLHRMVWVADRGFASAVNRAYLPRGAGLCIHAEKLRHTNSEAVAALARPGRCRAVAGNRRGRSGSWSATTPNRPSGTPPCATTSSRTCARWSPGPTRGPSGAATTPGQKTILTALELPEPPRYYDFIVPETD